MSYISNKLLLNILACGLLLSCPLQASPEIHVFNIANQAKWKQFTSTENGFSIDLPTEPQHVEQTIDIPKSELKISYDTYLSEPSENAVYVISVWNYPSEIDMSKPEVNLQDGFGGMLSALPGSEVQSMQMITVNGYKALEFLVKNDNIYFQGKLVLVHNTLYQVFTVYKADEDMASEYKHFIDSFKLIKPEKRAPKNGKELNV